MVFLGEAGCSPGGAVVLVSCSSLRVVRVGDGVTPGPMPWTPSQCQERIGRRGCRAQQGGGGGGESGSCRDWPWGQEAEGSSWADPGALRVWCHSKGQPRGSEAAWRWAPASPSSPGRLPCPPASCILPSWAVSLSPTPGTGGWDGGWAEGGPTQLCASAWSQAGWRGGGGGGGCVCHCTCPEWREEESV